MILTVAARAPALIIDPIYGLPRYLARYASSIRSLISPSRRRNGDAKRLGQDDVYVLLKAVETEAIRRLPLSLRYRSMQRGRGAVKRKS